MLSIYTYHKLLKRGHMWDNNSRVHSPSFTHEDTESGQTHLESGAFNVVLSVSKTEVLNLLNTMTL